MVASNVNRIRHDSRASAPPMVLDRIPTTHAEREAATAAMLRAAGINVRNPIPIEQFKSRVAAIGQSVMGVLARELGIRRENLMHMPTTANDPFFGMIASRIMLLNPKNGKSVCIAAFYEGEPDYGFANDKENWADGGVTLEIYPKVIGGRSFEEFWETPPKQDLSHVYDILPRGGKKVSSRASLEALEKSIEKANEIPKGAYGTRLSVSDSQYQ